jgi:hypothetical protein
MSQLSDTTVNLLGFRFLDTRTHAAGGINSEQYLMKEIIFHHPQDALQIRILQKYISEAF